MFDEKNISTNIHRYINNIFHECKVLKKAYYNQNIRHRLSL